MPKSKPGYSCEEVIDLALKLPDTTEDVSAKQIGVSRSGKGMLWSIDPKAKKLLGYQVKREDACVFAFRLTWENHDEFLESYEGVFWKRPHYEGYPALLVDTSDLNEETVKAMLDAAWEASILKIKMRRLT